MGTLCLFTWSSGFAEIIATVVGYSAVQAIQCCCSSDRWVTLRGWHMLKATACSPYAAFWSNTTMGGVRSLHFEVFETSHRDGL